MKRSRKWLLGTALLGSVLLTSCSDDFKTDYTKIDPDSAWLSGGKQTVFDASSSAYSHEFPVMPEHLAEVHEVGDVLFERTFVSAPAPINPGLGPIFNNVSCTACHIADGRGKPSLNGQATASMLYRLSIPGEDIHGGPKPVPGFGKQLQNQAVYGTKYEAYINITYTKKTFHYKDGTPYSLRIPTYTVNDPYQAIPGNVLVSPRVAPPVFGLGLLAAISEETILANADPDDANGDGISGKPNYVWEEVSQSTVLGRFGLKANQPSILQQVAAAFHDDMGLTSFIYPEESSYGQPQYDNLKDDYEITDSLLYSMTFYIRTLAVPARRNVNDPEVVRGEQLFNNIGCAKCHTPTVRTAVNVKFPAVSNQVIHPYTDLLLHDMGEGLADHRPDFEATGREWRTPPLWGIGLVERVNGHHTFLHDGRARNLAEAILWHGGEAKTSRNKFKALTAEDREALLAFLKSL